MPIHHTIRMPSIRQEIFLYFCFLSLPFLITIVSLIDPIIVIPIIVIYHTSICCWVINQSGKNCIFLCLKVIMDIVQLPWIYFKGLDTQFLCFKTIRNKKKYCWVVAYSLVAHLLCPKMIGNIPQGVWKLSHRFIAHFLHLKMLWDLSYPMWYTFIRHKHIYLCPWGWARVKFYGQKKRHHAQATLGRLFYQCKKPMKTWLNLRWKMMIQLLKLYHELAHLSM